MISIIVCSVNPEQNFIFKKNIEQLIGVPYELHIHDNREDKWGLCKVYNHYARISKYNILCFFHEDILFHTKNWGCILTDFFNQNPMAGIVGFAGSTVKTKNFSGWGNSKITSRKNIIQHLSNGQVKQFIHNPLNEAYSRVAVLDGLALITQKKVWEKYPFDETFFTGFHLYDLDFSLQIAQEYTNYVCFLIEIEHLSNGSYSKTWYSESVKFHQKWNAKIPFSVEIYLPEAMQKFENTSAYLLAKGDLINKWTDKKISTLVKEHIQTSSSVLYNLKLIKYVAKAMIKRIKEM